MEFRLFILCCFLQSFQAIELDLEDSEPDFPTAESNNFVKIVGGKVAPEGYAPYQCSIQYKRQHFCGCSIISNKWVLTASHCLQGYRPENLDILVGTNNAYRSGSYYKADKLVRHSKYNEPRCANDIGLLRIRGSIQFSDKVKPIELITEEIPEGTELELTGWGLLKSGDRRPQQLQVVKLYVENQEKCKEKFLPLGLHVGPSHFCTLGEIGKGACEGDSGGPIVLRSGSNVKLVGIVNFGFPCSVGYPDVFGKMLYFAEWIRKNTA